MFPPVPLSAFGTSPAWNGHTAASLIQTLIVVKLDPLTGSVVRFNKSEMAGSTRGDLIVRVVNQRKFVRLIYCPFDCGFDAPPSTEALPREMTNKGNLVWSFGVHEPQTEWERFTCGSIPMLLRPGRRPHEVLIEKGTPFDPTPGQAQVQVPKLDSLPCYVIGSWSKASGSKN